MLNTYRADIGQSELDAALKVVNDYNWRLLKDRSLGREFQLKPIIATEKKLYPDPFDIKEAKLLNVLYIDDMARNIPLKPARMTHGNMVDWDALDLIFQQFELYNPI
ncbi:hypothetical protein ACN9ML_18205 [Dyadobacter endophyticus]|uniref:hypothetical protein n=1 Tax=Dyadobacter endophyticus TaxID=1749036 RepID=UPI003CEC8104